MKQLLRNYWTGWVKCAEIMGPGAFLWNNCAYVPQIKREFN